MLANDRMLFFGFRIASVILCVANIVVGGTHDRANAKTRRLLNMEDTAGAKMAAPADAPAAYKWNVGDKELPLLGLPENYLAPGLDHSLSFPLDRFSFPIFQILTYDPERSVYVLPSFSSEGKSEHPIEFVT